MIVVGIVGILSAVVFPQYQRAKSTSEATATIAEVIAIAKQCAVGMKGSITMLVNEPFSGGQRSCNGNAQREINGRAWDGEATGVRCFSSTATSTSRRVRIIVFTDGDMNCSFL